MKILIVSRGTPSGGKAPFEADQARALAAAGHEVVMLALDLRSIRHRRPLGVSAERAEDFPVVVNSVPLGALPAKAFYALGVRAFKKGYQACVKAFGAFDIVHAHFLDNGYFAAKGLEECRGRSPSDGEETCEGRCPSDGEETCEGRSPSALPKLVITEHSSWMNRPLEEVPNEKRPYAAYAYRRADVVIAVSRALASRIESNFGVRCEVVPNIYDEAIFGSGGREGRCPSALPKTRFISVGNLVSIKQPELLVKCFAEVFPHGEASLRIIGDGERRFALEAMLREWPEADIRLLGRKAREAIAEELRASDVFVLLSERETFGVAYVEAMAEGLPVIATCCGGPEDFVTEANGLLIGDSPEEVKEALRRMDSDYAKYDRDEIARSVSDRFSPKAVAEQLQKVYEGLFE